jgi:hypothetical protein
MRRLFILFGIFCFFFHPSPVSSFNDFQIDLYEKYVFSDSGSCRVTSQVSITNLKSDIYATAYQLMIRGDPPQYFSGNDSKGPLTINVSSDGKNSIFDVTLNEPVIGKNSTQKITLSYSCPEAKLKGQIWYINLPKLSNSSSIYGYGLDLEIPTVFGKPAYMFPDPDYSNRNIYTFTKDQLVDNGVSASFGNFQTYSFTINYQLQNPTNIYQEMSIVIPSDTSYQKIQYSAIQPQPKLVSVDTDDNWIAYFNVPSNTNLTATVSGTVNVYSTPFTLPEPLSDEQLKSYLVSSNIWPVDNPNISKLSKQYRTPLEIFKYVVNTLNYDESRATNSSIIREGAIYALSNPNKSLCTEFTDLFITLARAAGIPSREVQGFAYTSNPQTHPMNLNQFLHAWPEYWDQNQKTWIGVDPTWEKTTNGIDYFSRLGFEHFAIAIHGINYPEPYLTSKNVTLEFSEYKDSPKTPLKIYWEKPFQIIPFFSFPSQVRITNFQGSALYKSFFVIKSDLLGSSKQIHQYFSVIPPFGTVNVPVSLKNSFWPSLIPHTLTVSASDQTVTYNIPRNLFIAWYACFASLCALFLILLAGFAIRSWSLYIQKHKTADNLRR